MSAVNPHPVQRRTETASQCPRHRCISRWLRWAIPHKNCPRLWGLHYRSFRPATASRFRLYLSLEVTKLQCVQRVTAKLRRLLHGVKSLHYSDPPYLNNRLLHRLAAVVLYGVHHSADVTVDDAVFGFIVFLVCTESWVIPHPVTNGEIVVHMPTAVLFHDGFFLARIGVNDRGIFRIGSVVIISRRLYARFSPCCTDLRPALPHWLLCSP